MDTLEASFGTCDLYYVLQPPCEVRVAHACLNRQCQSIATWGICSTIVCNPLCSPNYSNFLLKTCVVLKTLSHCANSAAPLPAVEPASLQVNTMHILHKQPHKCPRNQCCQTCCRSSQTHCLTHTLHKDWQMPRHSSCSPWTTCWEIAG